MKAFVYVVVILYVLYVTVSTANTFISTTKQPSVSSSEHKSNVPNVPVLETTRIHGDVTTSVSDNNRQPGPSKPSVKAKPSTSGKCVFYNII